MERMVTRTGRRVTLDTGTNRTLAAPGRRAPATVYWTRAATASLRADAERRFPGEACGVLGGTLTDATATIIAFMPVPNLDARADHFTVDPVDFASAEAALRERSLHWLGFAHSHPGGEAVPSAFDSVLLWRCCLQVIVPVRDGRAGDALGHWFDPTGTHSTIAMRHLP